MKIPHLVQYQGSKRNLAPIILKYFPLRINRLIEPFAGTAAISLACAARNLSERYVLNDLNTSLIDLMRMIVNNPKKVADFYEKIWEGQRNNSIEHYYKIREDFNKIKDPKLFLYLLARCVKGSVRYNSEGLFNQSPDKRRMGTRPGTMRQNIFSISYYLKEKCELMSVDYKRVLEDAKEEDLIYMDPPYQGVCGRRDSRYFSSIDFDDFVSELNKLNQRRINFIISYDGRCGEKKYGENLPAFLKLKRIEINAGRSTQATFLGKDDNTFESLYLSQDLFKNLNKNKQINTVHKNNEQLVWI